MDNIKSHLQIKEIVRQSVDSISETDPLLLIGKMSLLIQFARSSYILARLA